MLVPLKSELIISEVKPKKYYSVIVPCYNVIVPWHLPEEKPIAIEEDCAICSHSTETEEEKHAGGYCMAPNRSICSFMQTLGCLTERKGRNQRDVRCF